MGVFADEAGTDPLVCCTTPGAVTTERAPHGEGGFAVALTDGDAPGAMTTEREPQEGGGFGLDSFRILEG